MGVGDDEPHAPQAAARELAQELRPDRLGLGCADLHAKHLAAAVAVDADRDDHRDRDDAPAATDLQIGRVDPQVGPVAFDRAIEKAFTLPSISSHRWRTWLLEMPLIPILDQVADRARRDALHIGLLDHCRQRLLGHAARLQEAGEVGNLPELRDAHLHGPRASPSPGRSIRCVGPCGGGSSRHRWSRWPRPPPSP